MKSNPFSNRYAFNEQQTVTIRIDISIPGKINELKN